MDAAPGTGRPPLLDLLGVRIEHAQLSGHPFSKPEISIGIDGASTWRGGRSGRRIQIYFSSGAIEDRNRASLDVAINRITVCGNGAAIHFVSFLRGHKVFIDTKIKDAIRSFILHAAGRKRVENFYVPSRGIELEHLAGIKTVEPHHSIRSDVALRAAGMIVVIFRGSCPGLKLFGFDVKLRHGATLVTSRQPWIPLFIEFNRQIIFSQAGLERRYFPFVELTGAWIEPADIRALKIVVPDHLIDI